MLAYNELMNELSKDYKLDSDTKAKIVMFVSIYGNIKENCSINVKTYVIGVFRENIYDDKTYIKMQSFLSQLDFEYEYYEMFLGNKEMFKIINKEHENAETMDEIFKIIFKEIYEGGKGPRLKKESNIKDGMDGSMGKCIIF